MLGAVLVKLFAADRAEQDLGFTARMPAGAFDFAVGLDSELMRDTDLAPTPSSGVLGLPNGTKIRLRIAQGVPVRVVIIGPVGVGHS
jgi:hypothetical protein